MHTILVNVCLTCISLCPECDHNVSNGKVIKLAKRCYCNAGVCRRVCLCAYMCVRSPVSHYDFVECGTIVTKLAMEVAGYDTALSRNITGIAAQSKGQYQDHRNCKRHIIADNSGRHIVEMSNWCQDILKTKANKNRIIHFVYD